MSGSSKLFASNFLCTSTVLPASTTPWLPARYAGIIVSLKRQSRTLQYNRVLDILVLRGAISKIDELMTIIYVKAV